MKRVFLTGATGFIGSHAVRALVEAGAHVTALVRRGADLRRLAGVQDRLGLVEGDLESIEELTPILKDAEPEVCIHLAWYAVPGRYLHADENLACLAGSGRLLRALRDAGCRRLVAAGTCFEYDLTQGRLSEASALAPATLYAASKNAFALVAREFQRHHGLSFAEARIFYQYGPWEDERRLVPAVVRSLLRGEPCPLTTGDQVRDYLHVEDVGRALTAVAESTLEGPVNIGSGTPVTIREIAEEIGRQIGRPELLRFGEMTPPPGDPPVIVADSGLLREGTGWRPRYGLADGLADTIGWWRKQEGGEDR